jgi:hypothetical protein
MAWITNDFARAFDAEILEEAPYEEPILASVHDGIWVRVTRRNGSTWVAKFEGNVGVYPLPTGLVSCPNPEFLVVIACGTAYYVPVDDPARYRRIEECHPIRQVLSSRENDCILVADNARLTCIDRKGWKWTTGQIVFDDLAITGIVDREIHFSGFDPRDANGVVNGALMLNPKRGTVSRRLSLDTGTPLS